MRVSLNGTTRLRCLYFSVPCRLFMLMITRPSDLLVSVTVCGVFQLGSTLGTRRIFTERTVNAKDLYGGTHGKYRAEVLPPSD